MPPAISDDERSDTASNDGDIMPPKKPQPKKAASKAKKTEVEDDQEMPDVQNGNEQDDNDDEDDDEEGADEYVVEKIMGHDFGDNNICLYQVKWLGYESKDDLTWEPEENLEGAMDILQGYWDRNGGKPEPPKPKTPAKGKKGPKRKSQAADTPDIDASAKRGKRTKVKEEATGKEPSLPDGSWEDNVQAIEVIEEGEEVEGKKGLFAFIRWDDERQTMHSVSTLRTKCPLKLIDYYESKLIFKRVTDDEDEA